MTNAAPNGTATTTTTTTTTSFYALLKVDHDATIEDIHRAYKKLSTTFHPDKLPRTTSDENKEKIQQVFLEFKLASMCLFVFSFGLVWLDLSIIVGTDWM
jgi:DnaJ domain